MADEPMPPLGPPYGPPGPPPPPRFPAEPPLDWGPRLAPPFPEPPPIPPAPGTDRRLVLAAVGGVLVAILVAALIAVWTRDDGTPTAVRPRRTTTTVPDSTDSSDPFLSTDSGSTDSASSDSTSSSSATAADLEAVVKQIQDFVAQDRGLQFKTDVPVVLLSESDFNAELLKEFADSQDQLHESDQVLKAMGLIPTSRDIIKDERDLLTAGVLGFYDPKTKRLAVKGTETSPFVRRILAHELTHALDDQWFNLDRPELDTADDETGVAFATLAEGDARTVENDYADQVLSASERQQADDEENSVVRPYLQQIYALPPVLIALLQFPYDAGTTFISDLLDAGGNERVDQAFGAPPTTSEQVLIPDRYLQLQPPQGITDPAPDGSAPAANRGALGVLLLNQLLESGQSYDATRVDSALDSWGGDRYVTWIDGTRDCIKDVVVGDDAAGTAKMLQRFEDWAASPGVDAQVQPISSDPGSAFTIVTCSA